MDNPDLNLSASGDENNKTILLDTTASPEKSNNGDSPVEIEQEVTPQQSIGSLRILDLNDSNDEELLSRSNNLNNESGDQLSKQENESKEPTIDKDEPIVSNVIDEEEDAGLLEIVPVKPKKPDELDEDVSLLLNLILTLSNPNFVLSPVAGRRRDSSGTLDRSNRNVSGPGAQRGPLDSDWHRTADQTNVQSNQNVRLDFLFDIRIAGCADQSGERAMPSTKGPK